MILYSINFKINLENNSNSRQYTFFFLNPFCFLFILRVQKHVQGYCIKIWSVIWTLKHSDLC